MVAAATTESVNSKVKTILVTGAQHGGKGIGERELSTNTRNISVKAGSHSVEKAKRIFLNSDGIESIRFDYYRPETLTPEQSLSSGLRIPDIHFGGRGPPSTILVGSSLHNDPIMDLPYKVDKHNIE